VSPNTEDELASDRLSSPRRPYQRDSLADEEDYSTARNGGDYRMSNGRTGGKTRDSSDSVTTIHEDDEDEEDDDDDEDDNVDVRTDSSEPIASTEPSDDYFKPLKRLKMVQVQHSEDEDEREREASNDRGVKSFSILDILSHRPKAKIVRPWDTADSGVGLQHRGHAQHQHQQMQHHHPHHHHHHHHGTHHHPAHVTGPRDLSLMSMSLASMSGSISEPPLSSSSSSGRSSVSDSGSPDPLAHHHHHHAALHHAAIHPGLHHPALQQPQPQQPQQQQQFKRKTPQQHGSHAGQNGKRTTGQGSPLDALFQMTSKTFDAGEHSQGK